MQYPKCFQHFEEYGIFFLRVQKEAKSTFSFSCKRKKRERELRRRITGSVLRTPHDAKRKICDFSLTVLDAGRTALTMGYVKASAAVPQSSSVELLI